MSGVYLGASPHIWNPLQKQAIADVAQAPEWWVRDILDGIHAGAFDRLDWIETTALRPEHITARFRSAFTEALERRLDPGRPFLA